MDIYLKLSRVKTQLLYSHPFWASLATSLKWVEREDIPTAATDGVHLFYNKKFIEPLTEPQLKGIIAHEVCHVALKHHLRMHDRDPKKWNFATDFAINTMLLDQDFELPDGVLIDPQYKDMSSENIYNALPEDQDFSNEEEHVLSPSNPDGTDMTQDQLKELEANTDRMMKVAAETAKAMGKLPSGMKDIIGELLQPKVCWRDALRLHVQGQVPEDFSYRRPNRRRIGEGLYMPSVHKVSAGPVIAGLDTSGSVSNDELQAFMSELGAILEECSPESLTICEIDADIQNIRTFYPGDSLENYEIQGRGGTDMKPFFDFVETVYDTDATVVLCSDMYCYWDHIPEPWYEPFMLTTGSRDVPFGRIVKLNP